MRGVWALLTFSFVVVSALAAGLTDEEIRQRIVDKDLSRYSGLCPCPESFDSNGHRCGERSAYSRPGGKKPLCYPADVPDEEIEKYRKAHPA